MSNKRTQLSSAPGAAASDPASKSAPVNLTPHDLTFFRDVDTLGGAKTIEFVTTGFVARCSTYLQLRLATFDGIPLHQPPKFSGVSLTFTSDDMTTEQKGAAMKIVTDAPGVIVSAMVGEYITRNPLPSDHVLYGKTILSPDTGPGWVVRDARGKVKGSKAFILWYDPMSPENVSHDGNTEEK